MMAAAVRPALRLIRGALEDPSGWSWFCGQCASRPSAGSVSPDARVCPSCGMGLLLETRSEAAPALDDAFLVVDRRLTIQAVSGHAEVLLGVCEQDVINGPVARCLVDAEAARGGAGDFMDVLAAASTRSEEVRSVFVRPQGAFGVRVVARIAPCGPPRAALVVLGTDVPRPDLRVV